MRTFTSIYNSIRLLDIIQDNCIDAGTNRIGFSNYRESKLYLRIKLILCFLCLSAISLRAEDTTTVKKDFLSNEFIWGCTLGTPGFVNWNFGYSWNSITARIEAGWVGKNTGSSTWYINGVEAALGWNVYSTESLRVEVSAVAQIGASSDAPIWGTTDWRGIGVAVSANWKGFFAELGILPINTSYYPQHKRDIVPVFQIGYIH